MATETERMHCNSCGQKTKHRIVASHKQQGTEEIHEIVGIVSWDNTYEILECCGCETIKFRQKEIFSENDGPTITYFPPDVSRKPPDWMFSLPRNVKALLAEIYTALYANSQRLAAMGARTVLDLVIAEKVGDQGGFAKGIASLEQNG